MIIIDTHCHIDDDKLYNISKDVVLNLIKKYNAEDKEYLDSKDCVESIKELF